MNRLSVLLKKLFYFTPSSVALAALFALLSIAGIYTTGTIFGIDLTAIIGSGVVGYVFFAIALLILFNVLLSFLFRSADSFSKGEKSWLSLFVADKRFKFKHLNNVLVYAMIIVLLWLPFFIVFFPGNVYSDGYIQILTFYDPEVATGHVGQHPFFSTLVIGLLFEMGSVFGDNVGVFLIVLVEAVLTGAVYVYLIVNMERLGSSKVLCVGTAVFFGMVPLFATMTSTVWKDAFYLALFVLFEIKTIQLFLARDKKMSLAGLAVFLLLGVALCLFRKEGIYIFIITAVMLFFVVHKLDKFKVLGALCVFLLAYSACNTLGLTMSGVQKGQVSEEMMSIPMQVTAHYIIAHPDDISEHEWEVINSVFIHDAEVPIEEKYDSWSADPIKGLITSISIDTFKEYVAVWIGMGLRHPDTYLSGFVSSTYGYYTPLSWSDFYGTGPYEIIRSDDPTGYFTCYADVLDFYPEYSQSGEVRQVLSKYCSTWRKLPVFRQLVTPGLYVWAMLALATMLLRKRKFAHMFVFVPPLAVFAICLLGPVNGFVRYAIPFMACLPLLISFTLSELQKGADRLDIDVKRSEAEEDAACLSDDKEPQYK